MFWRRPALGSFPDLPANDLVAVPDPLALVRLGRPNLANLRGCLTNRLLVDALHDGLRRYRHLERDPGPRHDRHRVRVAHGEFEIVPFERRAVADALDLEMPL